MRAHNLTERSVRMNIDFDTVSKQIQVIAFAIQ